MNNKNENQIKTKNTTIFFLMVFSFIVGGVFSLTILKWTPLLDDIKTSTVQTIKSGRGKQVYEKTSLSSAISKVYDSVVMIKTDSSTGTGFIYKADEKYGYILTNQHVISKGVNISVVTTDDEQVEAKVMGGDEYLDLAVLRIDKKYVKQIITIGNSEKVNLGDTIFTVGSPLGENYRGSVTSGILSGKDRMVSVNVTSTNISDWIMKVLQIDASINPGNSGGPLLNVNGEVIGVCSMKLVDDEIEGMGFAIPIEYAMSHIESLEKGKKIEWPLLGIAMANSTSKEQLYANNIKIPENSPEGVVVVSVEKGTGAANSDLKTGDIITKLDGNEVKDYAHLRYELYKHKAGDTVEITYYRDNKEKKATVKLGKSS